MVATVRLLTVVLLLLGLASPAGGASARERLGASRECADGWLSAHKDQGRADAPCPGVRPGSFVHIPSADAGCTLNFLFTGYRLDENGEWVLADRFVGTAGHCVLTGEGTETYARGKGPLARDAWGDRIGEVAWAQYPGLDFALIRLDSDVEADPQMCVWGGPTGINADVTDQPTVLRFFGQGMVLSEVQPARTAVAATMYDSRRVFAYTSSIFGDSGSGVISDDGRAVGVLHSGGVAISGPDAENRVEAGTTFITRIGPAVATAEEALGLSLRLETAPRT